MGTTAVRWEEAFSEKRIWGRAITPEVGSLKSGGVEKEEERIRLKTERVRVQGL